MRQHDNSDPYITIQNETVLQRVDYDNFESKKPFRSQNSSLGYLNWFQRPLQLDIEVEVNESLQVLLNSTNASTDTDLIDVTLIRETPSLPETTVSLGKGEVKRFLDMVSRNQDGRNYSKDPKIRRSRTVDRKPLYKPYTIATSDEECSPNEYAFRHDNQTESIYTDFSEKTFDPPTGQPFRRHEKIYASPDMFSKLKSSLTCQHHRKYNGDNQKPGTPCLCQHCGMIGVLIESQKRPFIPHPTLPETKQHRSRSEHRKGRKSRIVAESSHDYSTRYHQEHYNAQTGPMSKESLFEDLLGKLQSLEARVLAQEEKAVGKDYFQYVIRKMLSQYIAKMVQSELPEDVKSSATQYSRIFLDESEIGERKGYEQRRSLRQRRNSSGRGSSGTNTREGSLDRNHNVNFKPEHRRDKNDIIFKSVPESNSTRQPKSKNVRYFDEEPPLCRRKHWKDIRTEKDLKERILSLIEREDRYENDKSPELSVSTDKSSANKEIKVESFQNTIHLPQIIRSGRVLLEPEATYNDKDRTVTTSAIKDLLDNMSSQIYEDLMKSKNKQFHSPIFSEERPKYNNMKKAMDDTLFKRNIEASKKREMQSVKNCERGGQKKLSNLKSDEVHTSHKDGTRKPLENLDLKYLNPAADIWGESSNAEFVKPICHEIIDKVDKRIFSKDSLTYKIEYLKGLAKSKNIDEDELWRSIWRQTKNRFKSKNDILTISIPSRKRKKRPIELELTWSDLKEIMRSTRSKSSREASSCDQLRNLKQKRESTLYQDEYTRKNHSYKQRSRSAK